MAPLPFVRRSAAREVDLPRALDRLAQQVGDLGLRLLVQLQRRAQHDAGRAVEAAAVGGRGDAAEDVLQVLAEDAAAGRAGQLLPVRLTEPDRRHRAIEVLERAAPGLGSHQFDGAEIVQQADVVADPPQGQVQLARQLVRAGGAPVQHAQQPVSQRMGNRPEQRFIEFARSLRRVRFGFGHCYLQTTKSNLRLLTQKVITLSTLRGDFARCGRFGSLKRRPTQVFRQRLLC